MNIGIDARLWYETGIGRYVRNLISEIDTLQTNNTYTIFLPKKAYKEVIFKSSSLRKVQCDIHWHSINEQFAFKKLLNKYKFDLVHFPYFSFPAYYNRPYVLTIHDLIIDHFSTGKSTTLPLPLYMAKRFFYKRIMSKGINNAKAIIAPSFATLHELEDHYAKSKGKVSVICEGFDPLLASKKTDQLISKNYILYVGNAYPHKNLERLFKAYKKVREKIDIDLICIGPNDFFYKGYEHQNMDGVRFLHTVEDSLLSQYYTNARCLVAPSLMEGFGLPLLEAMHLSCPVLSSNIESFKEIGGTAVTYFDPNSVDDMEKTITSFLQNGEDKEQTKEGVKRSKVFSWKKAAEETVKLYESCDRLR